MPHSVDQVPRLRRRPTARQWLLLAIAVVFTALSAWMLVDTLQHPAAAEPGQLWMALAILIMFGGATVLFGYEAIAVTQIEGIERAVDALAPAPLVATYSASWSAIGLAGSLAFALAGWFMLRAGLSGGGIALVAIGSLAAVVFGGFAAIGLLQLWQAGWSARQLSIEADGIRDARIGNRIIAWDEIASSPAARSTVSD